MIYNFIIQIIGEEGSGKSTIANIIETALKDHDITVENCNLDCKELDYNNVKDTTVVITPFQAQDKTELEY